MNASSFVETLRATSLCRARERRNKLRLYEVAACVLLLAAVRRLAHLLKGSVGGFGAAAAIEAAIHLENMGKDQEFTEIESAHANLVSTIEQLKPALRLRA